MLFEEECVRMSRKKNVISRLTAIKKRTQDKCPQLLRCLGTEGESAHLVFSASSLCPSARAHLFHCTNKTISYLSVLQSHTHKLHMK